MLFTYAHPNMLSEQGVLREADSRMLWDLQTSLNDALIMDTTRQCHRNTCIYVRSFREPNTQVRANMMELHGGRCTATEEVPGRQ